MRTLRDGPSVSEPLSVAKLSLCEDEWVIISTSYPSNFWVCLIRLIERILFQMDYPFEADNPSLV